MDVSNYKFSDDEIQLLKIFRDNQEDSRLKLRFLSLLMLAEGLVLDKVASIIGKSEKTIENWFYQYQIKGIESLNSFQYKPKKSFLDKEQIEQLTKWVEETNPGTLKQIRAYVKENFHVNYSLEGLRKLLLKNGLKLLKPRVIPGNTPNEEEQKKEIEQYFEMKENSEPDTVFLFVDGMHLVHQNVPGFCWGDPKNPPIHKTNTSRKRLNILGAYDPDSHNFIHLTGEENCDAQRVVEFLEVVRSHYRNAPKIIMIVDNATYFKAKVVSEWIENNDVIELDFLPPYTPNLNLIERFWRFAKEKLVKNKYYEKYKTFRAKVFQFLNNVDQYVKELESLMVEKFEIVKL
jgi:transposase